MIPFTYKELFMLRGSLVSTSANATNPYKQDARELIKKLDTAMERQKAREFVNKGKRQL